jgi:hypothetical protein
VPVDWIVPGIVSPETVPARRFVCTRQSELSVAGVGLKSVRTSAMNLNTAPATAPDTGPPLPNDEPLIVIGGVISEHATAAEAFREIDRLASEIVRTGAPSDAVELVVVDQDDRIARRPGVQ